ncbi:MAG: glycerophosphodiester phosphodiesterase, partial [Candidatus Bathyarchaeota archaeon]
LVITTGHRGAAAIEPENTLRGIRRAIEIGVDQIEIDIHLTKDGELVVIHDETVDRTTNGHGRIRDLTFEEIRGLDAGKGELVPTLQEVIDLTRDQVILQVELKGLGVEHKAVETVEEADIIDHVVFSSFRHPALKTVKKLNHNIATGVLFVCRPINPVQLALDAEAGAIHPNVSFVDEDLVHNAHALGLLVRAWNSDDEEEMRRLIGTGIDALGSNRPDLLVKVVRSLE